MASTGVSAHRHDELLQAARIGIGQQRIELELSMTPGIALAGTILDGIDRDRNGVISGEENRAFTSEVLGAMQLAIDGRPLRIESVATTFPTIDVLRGGDGPIELRAIAALPSLPAGEHHVTFNNAYRRDIGVYLTNALVPADDRIAITAQRRDPEQRTTTIDYAIASTSSAMLPLLLCVPAAGGWLLVRRRLLPI
jgi:hypothetical protein